MRSRLAVIALLLWAAAPSHSDAVEIGGVRLPPSIAVGGQSLDLAGCGTREALFSDVYVAALYLPRPRMPLERILSSRTAKAVRLHIVYDGTLPGEIPEDWREPLNSMLREDLRATLKNFYRRFESGDQVTLTYMPDEGVVASINGTATHGNLDHTLMESLLQLWIGGHAVSDNLRRLLLKGECRPEEDGLF